MLSNTGGPGKISPEIALLDNTGCGPLVGLVKKIDLIKLDGGVGRDAKKWVQPSISSRSDGIEILNPTSAEIYPDGAAFRHHPGKIRGPAEIVGPASETGPDPYGYTSMGLQTATRVVPDFRTIYIRGPTRMVTLF